MFSILKSIIFALWNVPNEVPREYSNTLYKRLFLRFDAYLSLLLYGATKDDYIIFKFYKLKYSERKKFITFFKGILIDRICVPKNKRSIMNDKFECNKRYSKFIKRSFISAKNSTDEEIRDFISKHGKVIVKPTGACFGTGIFIVENSDEKVDYLLKTIKTDRNYILEELVYNCKEIFALNKASLNTFRVVMVRDKKGVSHIIAVILRMGASDVCVDNAHSGGVSVSVNLETGVIDTLGVNISGNKYSEHPVSKIKFIGYKIPRFEELKNFAYQLMDEEPSIRYVGWDIAMLEDRCELIEGNRRPGEDVTQMCDDVPKYDLIKKYL